MDRNSQPLTLTTTLLICEATNVVPDGVNESIIVETTARTCFECKAPLHKKACARRHRALAHRLGEPVPYR